MGTEPRLEATEAVKRMCVSIAADGQRCVGCLGAALPPRSRRTARSPTRSLTGADAAGEGGRGGPLPLRGPSLPSPRAGMARRRGVFGLAALVAAAAATDASAGAYHTPAAHSRGGRWGCIQTHAPARARGGLQPLRTLSRCGLLVQVSRVMVPPGASCGPTRVGRCLTCTSPKRRSSSRRARRRSTQYR